MKTWRQFLEGKEGKKLAPPVEDKDLEDAEEEMGIDLDGDDEEGESKAHKEKVFGKKCPGCGKMGCTCGAGKCKGCMKAKKSCKC